jgi:hypothetical protein
VGSPDGRAVVVKVYRYAARWQREKDRQVGAPLRALRDIHLDAYGTIGRVELWFWFASIGVTDPLPALSDDLRSLVSA